MSRSSPDPNYERRVRDSFARQRFMGTMGARIVSVAPGEVVIELPWRDELAQQHGVLHAGAVASIADSACGYAALSLMPSGSGVMSVEFKVNLLAPGRGERFLASGRVRRAGRTLTICEGTVRAVNGSEERDVAIMTATMIRLEGRPDLAD
ncbi:MAG TPA: PaaI family thioesterase [Gemmatimonadaceae bacterium]|nr:PaaI family thioesterase [Gemmatimonadaceae bacterium]